MSKDKIVYEWKGTGRLEIDVSGNQYARLRYDPDSSLFDNPPPQSRKITANPSKLHLLSHNPTKNNPRKLRDFASHENPRGKVGEQMREGESQNDEPFAVLSRRAMEHVIAKDFCAYSKDLREMSLIVSEEEKFTDALKISMMKFHVDLSGLNGEPHIDRENIETAKKSIERANYSSDHINSLFCKTIREEMTPTHCFTVFESLELFRLALLEHSKTR